MNRPIVQGELALRMPSAPATLMDLAVGADLLDTLAAHTDDCVGLAGNMIGARKRIIAFTDQERGKNRLMFNPEIVSKSGAYETQEGCLSLVGKRPAKRYDIVTVRYQDESFAWQTEEFHGYTAQIIQHEIDHCNGIVI
ncbi:MAG: peptide deformylase [Coriobacteriia bacterium]|nr:peptide deformylase [Coriobacteriia bacterium]